MQAALLTAYAATPDSIATSFLGLLDRRAEA